MIKDKLPDGFPVEQTDGLEAYPCDNCGKVFDANNDGLDAFALGADGRYHNYTFCSEKCVFDFAKDNGLDVSGGGDDDFEFELEESSTDTNADPVAAAVKSINVGGVSTDGATDVSTDAVDWLASLGLTVADL